MNDCTVAVNKNQRAVTLDYLQTLEEAITNTYGLPPSHISLEYSKQSELDLQNW